MHTLLRMQLAMSLCLLATVSQGASCVNGRCTAEHSGTFPQCSAWYNSRRLEGDTYCGRARNTHVSLQHHLNQGSQKALASEDR